MQEHDFFAPRHKLPRPDCVAAGFDYPHEGWGLSILISEHDCPACAPRAMAKERQLLLIESHQLKERELILRETGGWTETAPRRHAYVMPPPISEQTTTRGGQFVAPTRRNTDE